MKRRVVFAALLCACGSSPIRPVAETPTPPAAAEERAASPGAAAFDPVPIEERGIGPFGTASPSLMVGADPEGQWFVGCQAREDTDGDGQVQVYPGQHGGLFGDRMQPYLFTEPGLGLPIDEVLAVEPSGDRLVYREGTTMVLAHMRTGARTELGATRADGDGSVSGGLADLRDGYLLYRVVRGSRRMFLRHLVSGDERELEGEAAHAAHAAITYGGRFVSLWVFDRDTDGDGAIIPMQEVTNRVSGAPCGARGGSSTSAGFYGDRPRELLAPIGGGATVPLEERVSDGEALVEFGSGVLVRMGDASLRLDRLDGTYAELSDAHCRGRVLSLWSPSEAILVRCAAMRRADDWIEMHTPTRHERVDVEAGPRPEVEYLSESGGRRFGDTIVDLESGARIERPEGNVLASRGTRFLLERDHVIHWLDVATGETRELGPSVPRRRVRYGGDMVALGDWTIDVAQGRSLGYGAPPTFVLLASGRRLTGRAVPRYFGTMPMGPFRWFDPPGLE